MSQILIEAKSKILCAYPGGDLKDFKSDPSRSFLKLPSSGYYKIFRNQKALLGGKSDDQFMTYVAPIYNDGNYSRGYIAI